jgi:hypothetical protein
VKAPPGEVIKAEFCSPNCTKKHTHNFLWDYEKNYKNDIDERPGVCFLLEMPVDAKDTDTDNMNYTGIIQSPINLDSTLEIIEDFQDEEFKFNYETIDPKASYKFNQQIESYYFPLKSVKRADNELRSFNYMNTATISLFDGHIPRANFFAHQFHFHSPSEHSIDGKLMDLEMHIVHKI